MKAKINKHMYFRNGIHIVGGPLTGWQISDSIAHVKCPRCKSDPGYRCQSPSGRKSFSAHAERLKLFNTK